MKKIKKHFFYAILLLILLSSCISLTQNDSINYQLVILHTNDTHGHPVKFFDYPSPNVGGIPARLTLINEIKKDNTNVLILDAGDINTGRQESNFFKAEPDIIGFNEVGYDAVVLGNHEFDNPREILKRQIKQAKFKFISANVKKTDGSYLVNPYIIKEYKGFKIAIFGLTTIETKDIVNPDNIKDIIFEDEIETAKKIVPELRKKADIIIALTHLGLYENDDYGSKALGKNVPGIDLIIDGHSHSKIEKEIYINKVPIVQAWQWGLYLGKGKINIQNKKITNLEWKPIPINLRRKITTDDNKEKLVYIDKEIKEDQNLMKKLNTYVVKVEKVLSEVICSSDKPFLNKNSRINETEIGDFIADSMLWFTKKIGADFALINGGGARSDIPEGNITKKDIYEIIPFDNSVVVLTLKGTDVKSLFDYIATIQQSKGGFPQVSDGISFTINYEKGICENILINGFPIDPNKEYKITTHSFLASGGDGYNIFKKAIKKYDTSMFQRDIIIEYIKSLGRKITPILKNRIKIIGSNMAYIIIFENKKAA